MIKVVHCKKVPNHEYVGRPSPLGNPFSHKEGTLARYKVATVDEAIDKYRGWFYQRVEVLDPAVLGELGRLLSIALYGDLNLGCWCAPKRCHADIIKEFLDKRIEELKSVAE